MISVVFSLKDFKKIIKYFNPKEATNFTSLLHSFLQYRVLFKKKLELNHSYAYWNKSKQNFTEECSFSPVLEAKTSTAFLTGRHLQRPFPTMTSFSTLSLAFTDRAPGLEVFEKANEWISVSICQNILFCSCSPIGTRQKVANYYHKCLLIRWFAGIPLVAYLFCGPIGKLANMPAWGLKEHQ